MKRCKNIPIYELNRQNFIKISLLILIFVFLSSLTYIVSVKADSESDAKDKLQGEVDAVVDELDISEFESYVNDLELFYSGGIKDFIKELSRGNVTLTPQNLLEMAFDNLTKGILSIIPSLLGIILIAVMFSLVFGLTSSFMKKQTTEIVYFVCYSAIITTVVAIIAGTIRDIKITIETLNKIVNALYPPLVTLLTAVGGGVSSGLFNSGLVMVSTLVSNVVTKCVLPLFIASVVFCVAGNLSSNIKLDKLQSITRYVAGVIMTISFGGLITYLSISGLIGGVTDSASIKATKYLVNSYVPIIGGYLSQGFDLVRVSMIIVKNAVGVSGVLAILFVMLAPAFKLLALTVGLKLTAGIIEPITDQRMSRFIGGIAESVRQLLGALLGVGFVFIVTISLLLFSLNSI